MAIQFYFYSIMAPESFFHKRMKRVLSPSHTTVLYSIQKLKRQDSDWWQFSSIYTPSWPPRASFINELTGYYRPHILQYCTVYRDLKKARFCLMAAQFYFNSIMGPESFFHKWTYRVLSPSHTTALHSIQGFEKGKILTDGSSVLFLLHHGAWELLPHRSPQLQAGFYLLICNSVKQSSLFSFFVVFRHRFPNLLTCSVFFITCNVFFIQSLGAFYPSSNINLTL